jgi:uncharacterized tellurite resistance protein B-like protein
MSKAAKRKHQPTDDTAMTTEQLAEKVAEQIEQMSPEEKAELRAILNRAFGRAHAARKLEGFADAARRCAAEEAALANYDGNGKPVH